MVECGSLACGPSPRAWGLRLRRLRRLLRRRSIPTGVGTTGNLMGTSWEPPVHPHGRGDYSARTWPSWGMTGPSPRAWGLHSISLTGFTNTRSIPTGVGTTGGRYPIGLAGSVHPHGRGDYQGLLLHPAAGGGPSPRAWGLRGGESRRVDGARSIPTGVGTTGWGEPEGGRRPVHPHGRGDYSWTTATWYCTAVHPHGRGDYIGWSWRYSSRSGPSPRAWGLRWFRSELRVLFGPSPRAWGLPHHPLPPHLEGGPSPRAWGLPHHPLPPHLEGGPSPRAWGLPGARPDPAPAERSIPTGVGTTRSLCPVRAARSVHPHGRGDYCPGIPGVGWCLGPSPRAWGLRAAGRPR